LAARDLCHFDNNVLFDFCIQYPHFLLTNEILTPTKRKKYFEQNRLRRETNERNSLFKENTNSVAMGSLLLLYSPWLLLEIVLYLCFEKEAGFTPNQAIALMDIEKRSFEKVINFFINLICLLFDFIIFLL
jgi:hypothetical protein